MKKKIEIFTDGSCIGNPGPGGYGIIFIYKNYKKHLSAGYKITTNNRMELMAAITALNALKYPHEVILSTDSQYVRHGIIKWIHNWKNHGWKNKNKKSIKNIDLWLKLDLAIQPHILKWLWIKSHNGHHENNFCDELARYAANHPTLDDIGYLFNK